MTVNLKTLKELQDQLMEKEKKLSDEGKDRFNNKEYVDVIDALIWLNHALQAVDNSKSKGGLKGENLDNFKVALIELKRLGVIGA